MGKDRKEVRIIKKELPAKLGLTLKQVCSQGYVKYKGKWYRGCSPIGQKPNCDLCDFAGCEAL